ncbi:MAG: hypothetical protein ACOH2N_00115 [Devosia sp.]
MNYNPRIYIRDYGAPTHRFLAYWAGFYLNGIDAALKRHLIMHAEGPDTAEPFLLLSGDMTDGDDILALSGVSNDLMVIATSDAFRLFGSDVELIYSIKFLVDVTPFDLTGGDVGFLRDLFLHTDTGVGTFTLSTPSAGLAAQRIIVAGAGTFTATGIAADLTTDEFIELSGDASDGDDLLLLSGDMQDGTDFLTISTEGL